MFWFQETKPAGADNDHINLRVIGQNNSEVHFRIKKTTQMKKLKAAFCERQVISFKIISSGAFISQSPKKTKEINGHVKILSVSFNRLFLTAGFWPITKTRSNNHRQELLQPTRPQC